MERAGELGARNTEHRNSNSELRKTATDPKGQERSARHLDDGMVAAALGFWRAHLDSEERSRKAKARRFHPESLAPRRLGG